MRDHQTNSRAKGTTYTMLEVLLKIIAYLCPSDLRRLRFVNHKFYTVVETYRAQFSKGLTALPNDIILEIIQYLSAQVRSRLARVSHRFYPFIMDFILRDNVRCRKSSLLRFSVKNDLRGLMRRLAYRGGDLNPTTDHSRGSAVLPSPFSVAAYYGYEGMVRLLLELGARPSGQGSDIPLAFAIAKRHERVALIILQSSDSISEDPYITSRKLLRMASAAKMVTLVSHVLVRRSELHMTDVDTALYHVLLGDISKGNTLKRVLHHEAHQIVRMLLQNGANPDNQPRGKIILTLSTARLLSQRHPDPRVRALLPDTGDASLQRKTNGSGSRVGRSWVVSPDVAAERAVLPDLYACQALPARLGDFLEELKDDSSLEIQDRTLTNDHHFSDEEVHDTRSTTFDLESFLQDIRQPKVSDRSLTAESLSSDAFPRLGISEETAQRAVRGVWPEPNPSVHSSYTAPDHAPKAGTTMLSFRWHAVHAVAKENHVVSSVTVVAVACAVLWIEWETMDDRWFFQAREPRLRLRINRKPCFQAFRKQLVRLKSLVPSDLSFLVIGKPSQHALRAGTDFKDRDLVSRLQQWSQEPSQLWEYEILIIG